MTRSLLTLLAVIAIASSGCKDASSTASESTTTSHAAETARPGTHADWCGEHAVPESQCTQCHKELIAAFKATDDWCEEHGLPESHCKKCNPDLVITRPPKASDGEQ